MNLYNNNSTLPNKQMKLSKKLNSPEKMLKKKIHLTLIQKFIFLLSFKQDRLLLIARIRKNNLQIVNC
jgi:hypothetical protein